MPTLLKVSKTLSLPIDAATQKLFFGGTTGSGKTYGAMKLAEQMWHASIQFVALDTMGIWYGMRIASDGKNPGLPITVIGGKHGDLPLHPDNGHLVAEIIHHERISAIVDMSQFETDSQKARFVSDFADRIYRLQQDRPSAIHLFLEEAHEFIPQNPQEGEKMMLHRLNRIWKQGRNFGIGGSIITQRPQDVNKKASGLSAAVFMFNITGKTEFKDVKQWLQDVDGIDQLPSLEKGTCLLWSPAWLRRTEIVRFGTKETFHVSFDPFAAVEVDQLQRTLAPVAIEALKERMAVVIEEEEQADPKKLQAKIKQLEKQLATGAPSEALIRERVDAATAPLLNKINELEWSFKEAAAITRSIIDAHEQLFQFEQRLGSILHLEGFVAQEAIKTAEIDRVSKALVESEPRPAPKPPRVEPVEGVSGPQSRILQALASFHAIGVKSLSKGNAAVFSDQSPKSSGYRANLSALSSKGLIRYGGEGIEITEEGLKLVGKQSSPATLADLHRAWFAKLSRPQSSILKLLIEHYPDGVHRSVVASKTNQSPKSSGYRANLSKLSGLGLIRYVGPDVAATGLLFPEGLK